MPFSYGLVMYGASGAGTDLPELIEKVTFSGATTATSSTLSLSGYHTVEIFLHIDDVGDDDNNNISIQLSTDDGSTWDTGGNDYSYAASTFGSDLDPSSEKSRKTEVADGMFLMAFEANFGVGATAPEGLFAKISIQDPGNTNFWKQMVALTSYSAPDAVTMYGSRVVGARRTTSAIDKIRIRNNDGGASNIAGTMYIYGWPS